MAEEAQTCEAAAPAEGSNFLAQFGDCHTISMSDFMTIWKNYDTDKSGFLDVTPNEKGESEFERFLVDLVEIVFAEKLQDDALKNITEVMISSLVWFPMEASGSV